MESIYEIEFTPESLEVFKASWAAFEVGDGDDFAREVELTGQNQELWQFLAGRRSHAKRVPLSEVKEQLGLG